MDAASDVAFLAMDLAYRGREKLAEQLLSGYANSTDDFDLFRVIDYFQGYRALVRAWVAAFGSADSALGWDDPRAAGHSVERYLELAERMLRWRSSGSMILLCGRAGTGKSTVAEFLSGECGGILVSLDRLQGKRGGSSWEVGAGVPPGEVHPPIRRPRSEPCWSALRGGGIRSSGDSGCGFRGPSLDAIAPGVGRSNGASVF
jgi:hypothetical protein